MHKLHISPGDTLSLLDRYTAIELTWFTDKLNDQVHMNEIVNTLKKVNELIIVHNTGTKKGNRQYSKWRNEQVVLIEDIKIKKDTVFAKLKYGKKKGNTIFSNLKYFSKG